MAPTGLCPATMGSKGLTNKRRGVVWHIAPLAEHRLDMGRAVLIQNLLGRLNGAVPNPFCKLNGYVWLTRSAGTTAGEPVRSHIVISISEPQTFRWCRFSKASTYEAIYILDATIFGHGDWGKSPLSPSTALTCPGPKLQGPASRYPKRFGISLATSCPPIHSPLTRSRLPRTWGTSVSATHGQADPGLVAWMAAAVDSLGSAISK